MVIIMAALFFLGITSISYQQEGISLFVFLGFLILLFSTSECSIEVILLRPTKIFVVGMGMLYPTIWYQVWKSYISLFFRIFANLYVSCKR